MNLALALAFACADFPPPFPPRVVLTQFMLRMSFGMAAAMAVTSRDW